MRLDDSASSGYESVLARPQREDRCRCWTRDVKGPGRSHLRSGCNLSKALREAKRGSEASYSRQSARQESQARSKRDEAARARSAFTASCHLRDEADLLCELLGVRVSKSTICRMVGRLGYTRKKDRWVLQKETNGSERLGGGRYPE